MTAESAAGARTFLIADIRGYTAYTAERGDDEAAALARRFAELARDVVEAHEGLVIELRGDEALCAFVSARQALRAAIALQERFREEQLPRGVGIGIDSGEAVPVDGGFRGTALNLAARLCAQAKPGQIIASEAAIHLAAHVDGIAYVEPRTLKLKGYDAPVRAVDVVVATDARVRARSAQTRAQPLFSRRVLAAGAVALVVIALGAAALSGAFAARPTPAPSQTPLLAASTPSASIVSSPSASAPAPTTPSVTAGRSEGPIATGKVPALAFLDPASGQIESVQAAIPNQVDFATFADGAFWQLGLSPNAVYKIDPVTHAVSDAVSLPLDSQGDIAIASGTIWVTDLNKPRVVGIDVATGSIVHDYTLSTDPADGSASGVALGAGALWVSLPRAGAILRVDPTSGVVQKRIDAQHVDVLAFGNDALWVNGDGYMSRVDPATNEVTFSTQLSAGDFMPYMTFSSTATWTADDTDGSVYKVDRSGQILAHYQAGVGARSLQYMDGNVWVAAQDDGAVTSIDADTGSIKSYPIGHEVTAVAAGSGAVMVAVNPSPEEVIKALSGKVLKIAMPGEALQQPAPDPATNPYQYNRMILYATCSRLLSYGDESGPGSYDLRPEVAADMPQVSADGLTYSFTVRPGFAFSPPSNEPITADTYRFSMERALSPGVGNDGLRAITFWSDIAGATDYHDGKADHVSGLQADGDTLRITLSAPSADFLERLTMPFSCPVPMGTPAEPLLDPPNPVASSGPYYLAAHGGGEYAILRQNPNYGGTRPHSYDAIAIRFGLADGEAPAWVDDGRADMAIGDVALQAGSDIANRYGPDSAAAKAGDQRWYGIPYPGIDFLMLNPNGALTGDQTVRRAIALALDRAEVAQSYNELPATSVLGSAFVVRDPQVPGLIGPDTSGAQALLAGKTGTIRMAIPQDCSQCTDSANSIKSSVAPIGITLDVVEEENPLTAAEDTKLNIDLLPGYAQPFYPDGASLLKQLVSEEPQTWLSPAQLQQADALGSLSGDARAQAAATFAQSLVQDVRVIPYGYPVDGVYFGPSVGCRTIVAGITNVDLAALCPATP